MGHDRFDPDDPRFWDWNIKELALYDLPALVDFVLSETGYTKVSFETLTEASLILSSLLS